MNRGDVWTIDLGGHAGIRPVLILACQNVLEHLNKVVVVEITSKGKGYPTEVFIGQKANLPMPSFVQADNLHTLPKNKLENYVGTLDAEALAEISRKAVLALQLESCFHDL